MLSFLRTVTVEFELSNLARMLTLFFTYVFLNCNALSVILIETFSLGDLSVFGLLPTDYLMVLLAKISSLLSLFVWFLLLLNG